nr:farnesol dehydrogenase-like [Megalopta genalis]
MDRWAGKVALVTGSSGGIGWDIAKSLVEHGVQVVGLARRLDKLQELAEILGRNNFYPVQCDVAKEDNILKAFKWAEEKLGGVDILVNNAAISIVSMMIDLSTEDYRKVININLLAPMIFAREFINAIRKRNASGHILNISSIAGRYPETFRDPIGIYCVTKSGLYTLGVELRHEIMACNLDIRVTTINPGAVKTNMVRDCLPCIDEFSKEVPILSGKNIADTVIYALGSPPGAEVFELTIIPQNVVLGTPVPQLTEYQNRNMINK